MNGWRVNNQIKQETETKKKIQIISCSVKTDGKISDDYNDDNNNTRIENVLK